jgi:hypothetical protein
MNAHLLEKDGPAAISRLWSTCGVGATCACVKARACCARVGSHLRRRDEAQVDWQLSEALSSVTGTRSLWAGGWAPVGVGRMGVLYPSPRFLRNTSTTQLAVSRVASMAEASGEAAAMAALAPASLVCALVGAGGSKRMRHSARLPSGGGGERCCGVKGPDAPLEGEGSRPRSAPRRVLGRRCSPGTVVCH